MTIVKAASRSTTTRCIACRWSLARTRSSHTRPFTIASNGGGSGAQPFPGFVIPLEASRETNTRSEPVSFTATLRASRSQQTKADSKLPKKYFDPSNRPPDDGLEPQGKPPDENRANLGRTLRILQDRLPTLLQSPLQQDILAPNISLHLFPSTHPHLPTVSGRVAYTAALWTSPIAWNRFPVIGNVRLSIISARMTREPVPGAAPLRQGSVPEQLVVRWSTRAPTDRTPGTADSGNGAAGGGINGKGRSKDKDFSGLFIFQFDREGRILSHTIETVQGSGDWEKGMGAKFVGLTDWLLGGLGRGEPSPAFGKLPSSSSSCSRYEEEGDGDTRESGRR